MSAAGGVNAAMVAQLAGPVKPMAAKFAGKCASCLGPIPKGSSIGYFPKARVTLCSGCLHYWHKCGDGDWMAAYNARQAANAGQVVASNGQALGLVDTEPGQALAAGESVAQPGGDMLAAIEAGVSAATETPESWRRYLDCAAKFHDYSFGNMLMIWTQYPQAERVAGFHTWRSLGRWVVKGAKGIRIYAPMLVKVKDGQPEPGAEPERRVYFKAVSVFDISQTDGEPLPALPGLADGDDGGLLAGLLEFAAGRGIEVDTRAALPEGYKGLCQWRRVPGADGLKTEIKLAASSSRLDQCCTLAHELAHALNDSPDGYREHAADMELRAESVAYMVLKHFGFDSGEHSFYYIRGYQARAGKDATKQLRALGKSIQETAEQLINAVAATMAAAAAEPGAGQAEYQAVAA